MTERSLVPGPSFPRESDAVDGRGAHGARFDAAGEAAGYSSDAGPVVVTAIMSAMSGALVGFVLAGAFEAAFLMLPTAMLAGYLGWRVRGAP